MTSRLKFGFVTFLTFVRFPLVLLFFGGALWYSVAFPTEQERPLWLFVATFGALGTSALTDLFDGYFARRFQVETRLGAHADPLMDKFFYLTTLPLLVFISARSEALAGEPVGHSLFLLILTLLFLLRDQWVTFLRSIGAIYNVSGSAHWSGKLRTFINFPLICCIYYYEEAPASFPAINRYLLFAFEGFGLVINFLTLAIYSHHYWPSLRKAATIKRNK